jgi:beta-N-acetylhexosaminidase
MRIHRGRAVIALAIGVAAAIAGLSVALGDDDETAQGRDAGDLSVRELAGERLIAGFSGEQPPDELRQMIRGGDLAGVVLFSDNFDDRSEARRLVRELQSIRRPAGLRDPLLVMVDQEGGQVKRLPGSPDFSAEQMGDRGAGFSRRQGRLTARNLSGAEINVDLAPVLDVARPGSAIEDEDRSFGTSAAQVTNTGVPFALGLQGSRVAATAKHFPGLGAAELNTDFGVVEIDLSKRTLRDIDEAPFRSFIAAGGRLVMMSNAIYTAFSDKPAVFTRGLATGELRERLGFEGVSVSDALQAVAAEAFGGPAKTALAAARAGTDLLLFRQYRAAARAGSALRANLRAGNLRRPDFEVSVQRVLDLRAELPR